MPSDRLEIASDTVHKLIADQFPQWAGLPVTPVARQGWDNCTFRLGDAMSVRMPRNAQYALKVDKELHWRPKLAPRLPLPIPVPIARGESGEGYPYPWSISDWLEGVTLKAAEVSDLPQLARDLGDFLKALQAIELGEGLEPGTHNFFRGAPPHVYDAETQTALATLERHRDVSAYRRIWEQAIAAPPWSGRPVWLHGDMHVSNLLFDADTGRLCAVIDFGGSATGDPACDLTIAWTLFDQDSRAIFRSALGLDDATWQRARGWAVWKALILLANDATSDDRRREAERVLSALKDDEV